MAHQHFLLIRAMHHGHSINKSPNELRILNYPVKISEAQCIMVTYHRHRPRFSGFQNFPPIVSIPFASQN